MAEATRAERSQPLLSGVTRGSSVQSESSAGTGRRARSRSGPISTGSFCFVGCTYVVRLKRRGADGSWTRTLVDDCSASIPAGEVLALMGPSGAGKTTLLNMLTLERSGGWPSGSITLNGHAFTKRTYQRHACYVTQTDQLWPFLTAREHLEFASALYQPNSTAAELCRFVRQLLKETGLEECQETRAGNEYFKGLSGGQKRRLSLVVALCKKPHVVFLDEPTSGLDAASAASIMHFLKETAARMHIAIVCTVHQPSTSVFGGFDKVCFLTGGRFCYLGSASELPAYLASVGKPLPPNSNPADFMLDLTNRDFSEGSVVEHMLREWRSRAPVVGHAGETELFEPPEESFGSQLRWLASKHLLLVGRDPMLYTGRAILNVLSVSFFALIYIRTRILEQQQIFNRTFFCFWVVALPASLGVVTVLAQFQELLLVRREVKDGMYSPLVYALVNTLIQVPMMVVLSLCALLPGGYGIEAFELSGFTHVLLFFSTLLWSLENLGQLNALGSSPLLGMLNYLQGFAGFMVFAGILLQPSHVTWAFRWIAYVSPLRWSLSMFIYYVIIGTTYEGAVLSNTTPAGFVCPGDLTGGLQCYGVTGRQILQTLSHNYETITPDLDFVHDYLILLAIALAFKICYVVALLVSLSSGWERPVRKTSDATHPAAPHVHQSPLEATERVTADLAEIHPSELPSSVGAQQRSLRVSNASVRSELSTGRDASLCFVGCTYVVRLKRRGADGSWTRTLVDDCSASIPAGEVLALMGPSGAGKTTLLNMLTLERSGGWPSGSITLNGHAFTKRTYQRHACYVTQTDQLWPFLTAREHLEFASALYQPNSTAAELCRFVRQLLKETGLEECQETRAGNEYFKGLSGGQKRRLSLVVALCKKPHVVFLDEPTSGLDAASAASIMHFLKETAARMHIAIVCTVHQPSTSVFGGFDKVCFLTGGRFCYLGSASKLPAYLASVGKPLPPNSNPADFMLDLTNRDFSEGSVVEHMLREWRSRAPVVGHAGETELFEPPEESFGSQLRWLASKHLLLVGRDPMQYSARILLFLITTNVMAILYIQSRNLEQAQALDRLFLTNWLISLPGMFCLVTVYACNLEGKIISKEVKDGMYWPMAYVLVQLLIQFPAVFFLSFWACFPAGYPLANFPWSGFLRYWLVYFSMLMTTECTAQAFSLLANPLFGLMNYMQVWFMAFLFNGISIPVKSVIWPFRSLCYATPYRWGQAALCYIAFIDSPDYAGAERCNASEVANGSVTYCNMAYPDSDGHGFFCPELPAAACYGRTGAQILTSLGFNFQTISADDEWLPYSGLVFAQVVFWKVLFLLLFVWGSRRMQTPRPSQGVAVVVPKHAADGSLLQSAGMQALTE